MMCDRQPACPNKYYWFSDSVKVSPIIIAKRCMQYACMSILRLKYGEKVYISINLFIFVSNNCK